MKYVLVINGKTNRAGILNMSEGMALKMLEVTGPNAMLKVRLFNSHGEALQAAEQSGVTGIDPGDGVL